MGKRYSQLSGDERNQLQRGLNEGMSLRFLARSMGRNPSTLSREYRRGLLQSSYDAVQGGEWARSYRRRGPCKLLPGNPLTEQVHALILERTWSPEQIAGRLRVEHPDASSQRVCHETIYQHIYAHPAGELKKMLIDALRKGHQKVIV